MIIDGFDWDEGNLFKNKEARGISPETIEALFRGSPWVGPDMKHSSEEDRFLAFGRCSNGRHMAGT